MSNLKTDKNDEEGTQFEWRGVLVTLRPNEHHGFSGSVALSRDDGGIDMVEFHGSETALGFPLGIHEVRYDKDNKEIKIDP